MSSRFSPDPVRIACRLAAALLSFSAGAFAAPGSVLPFGPQAWTELQGKGRPQAVVFSTTDCSHCPAAIDRLAATLRSSSVRPRLTVVVMDGQGQEASLLTDRHYRQADAIYAFDGDAANLRYRVNPDWRGVTPYVVLLPARGEPRYFTGSPPAAAMRSFLQP